MALVLLHGGGDLPEARAASYGPLVNALIATADPRLALIVCAAEPAEVAEITTFYHELFTGLGLQDLVTLQAAPEQPLRTETLAAANPAALFICGGATPYYQEALCTDQGWLSYVRERDLALGGTSAGAAVLARMAIVGGWQAERGGKPRPMLFKGASEGLDPITVRPGLAVVDDAVDVHASQFGTLLRLIHAVDLGLVPAGWAIDENTSLVLGVQQPMVVGAGHVYRVEAGPAGSSVNVLIATA